MTLATGIIRDPNVLEIIRHPWFVSAFLAGGLAQLIKMVLAYWRTRRLSFRHLVTAGGMPSAHAALVTALSVAVGLTEGFDAPYAMIAVGFAAIVLTDAATLRREAGEHAKVLNRLIATLNDRLDRDAQIEFSRLTESIGHKRREVIAGVLFGIVVAFSVCAVWDFWKTP